MGLREREAFVDRLAAPGNRSRVARFGLLDVTGCGFAAGANRNALLLATRRERFLSVDDDVVCALARPRARARGSSVFSSSGDGYENYNPADFWFFGDRAALERAVHPEDTDALGLHEAVLGRDLGACRVGGRGRAREAGALRPAPAGRVHRPRRPGASHAPGLFGDIGWYAPTWLLLPTGASRERFTRQRGRVRERLRVPPEVLRVVPRPTITDGRFFQSTLLGLDSRVPLAPVHAVQRYEDGVFRIALRACFEDAYFAHLPWAAWHDSDEDAAGRARTSGRPPRVDPDRGAAGPLRPLVRRRLPARTPGAPARPRRPPRPIRGRAPGRRTSRPSSAPASSRRKARHLGSTWRRCFASTEHAPAYWARDLRRHAATVRDALGTDAFFVPRDLVVSRQAAGPGVAAPRRAGRSAPWIRRRPSPSSWSGDTGASPPLAGSRGRDAGASGARRGAGRGRGRGMRAAPGGGARSSGRSAPAWLLGGLEAPGTMANVRCQKAPLT